jgi:hypothetical protein
VIGLNAWAWKERGALESKRQAAKTILTQTFPSVKIVIDPQLQMTREVAALQQAVGDVAATDFEPMVGALATNLPPAARLRPSTTPTANCACAASGCSRRRSRRSPARWRRAATTCAPRAICCSCRPRPLPDELQRTTQGPLGRPRDA